MSSGNTKQTLFFTTRWTLVCDAARGGDQAAVDALEALFGTYWQPLYRYARRCGQTGPDSEDLVQGFFTKLLEQQGLRLADRDRGRFRAFLLGGFKNFMAGEWRRSHRLKRGGFSTHLSVDWQHAETHLKIEPEDHRSPDKLYDRDWAMALLDKVLNDLEREEKDANFSRWKAYLGMSSLKLPYEQMAAESGLSAGAVRVAVHRLRKRYRERLRAEIARTIADDAMVEDEMRSLFAALSS